MGDRTWCWAAGQRLCSCFLPDRHWRPFLRPAGGGSGSAGRWARKGHSSRAPQLCCWLTRAWVPPKRLEGHTAGIGEEKGLFYSGTLNMHDDVVLEVGNMMIYYSQNDEFGQNMLFWVFLGFTNTSGQRMYRSLDTLTEEFPKNANVLKLLLLIGNN